MNGDSEFRDAGTRESASAGGSAFGDQRPADAAAGSVSPEPVVDGGEEDVAEGLVGDSGPAVDEADPLTELMVERDEYRDALVRLQADFENYKKRIMKQQTEHLERAAASLVEKLLPVLDAVDLALAHGGGEDVQQVGNALYSALEREGLERIDPAGEKFDPNLHDAVAHEPADGGPQEVAEVLRAGYVWKGRVLRPAMVKVRG